MACISAKTGTKVFAYFNLSKSITATLYIIKHLVYTGLGFYHDYTPKINSTNLLMTVSDMSMILSILFLALVVLMFSSFLVNGIRKQKPEHIKVYFIFGVVKVVIGLFALLISFGSWFFRGVALHFYTYIIIIVYLVIYSLILYMIRYTYLKFETINKQLKQEGLDENKC